MAIMLQDHGILMIMGDGELPGFMVKYPFESNKFAFRLRAVPMCHPLLGLIFFACLFLFCFFFKKKKSNLADDFSAT